MFSQAGQKGKREQERVDIKARVKVTHQDKKVAASLKSDAW